MKHQIKKQKTKKILLGIFLLLNLFFIQNTKASTLPVLNFSDIESGPKIGNSDLYCNTTNCGTIVTIWGNYLGESQGNSKIYIGNQEVTQIYYWKNADGQLPGGPADLYTYHKMQEIAFAIPSTASDGLNTIKLVVNGIETNTLQFTVRSGNIRFIKEIGNDTTGDGSWGNAWGTIQETTKGGNNKIFAGDILYAVGVESLTDIRTGRYGVLDAGTVEKPFALITYPNTTVNLMGNNYAIGGWDYAESKNWQFSKLFFTTQYQAVGLYGNTRVVGSRITGPTINSGYSGWIGGNCTPSTENPTGDPSNCGGHKLYGNEVFNYGKNDGTVDAFHHLYYISNRSGHAAPPYEIAWNNHHDNPIAPGIHIYDQNPCGGWSGPIKIYNNVVKNQGSASINLNVNCPESLSAEVYNNIIITDTSYNLINRSAPGGAFNVWNAAPGNIKIYNNTVFGYGNYSQFATEGVDYKNNLMFDNRGINYFPTTVSTPVESQGGNLFFSSVNPALAIPASLTNSIKADPLFTNPASYDFSLQQNSPAINTGSDNVLAIAPRDFFGQPRIVGKISIGAIDYNPNNLISTSFNISNFTTLLSNWLKKESDNAADLNSDGIINSRDLGIMMGKWN